MNISKNSQVYSFLHRYGEFWEPANPYYINNLCQLWTRLAILTFCLIAFGTLAGMFVLGTIQLVVVLFGGPFIFFTFALWALIVWIIITTMAACVGFAYSIQLWEKSTNSEPGIIRETISGWKNKYCPTVNWVDRNN